MAEDSNKPKEIDRFDDVFHKHNDDADEDKDEYTDFDNQYQTFHTQNDDDNEMLLALAQYESDLPPINVVIEEQQESTDQLSTLIDNVQTESEQLKATTSTSTVKKRPSITPSSSISEIVTTKKSKTTTTTTTTENIDEKIDADLPRFLSRTKDIFQETIQPILITKRIHRTINIEQLRKIALLKFHIAINNLDISLWTTYLQSGTGRLPEQDSKQQQPTTIVSTNYPKLKRWPSDLKTKMIESGFISSDNSNQEITDDIYLNFVYKRIRRCRDKNLEYQNELREEKQTLSNNYTLEIDDIIDKFVEQHGTSFHRVPINGQISTIEYKYKDRLLELEFNGENPLEYQLETFQTLSKLKYEKETTKMMVAILKQRLLYNHLPTSFESLHIPEPISLDTIDNNNIRQRLTEQYHKVLQRTKSDMLQVYIATEQAKADQCLMKFNQYYEEMKDNQEKGQTFKKLTSTMLHLLRQRLTNINKHIISDGQELNMNRRSDIKKSTIACSPTIYQNTIHQLSSEQITFLNRGPSYVIPCQIHILASASSSSTLDQIVQQQMLSFKRQLTATFTKYPIDLARRMKFQDEIRQLIKNSFILPSIPLTTLQERILYEKQLLQSIRNQLDQQDLILRRTADNQNTYYLGQRTQFNFKASEYIQTSDCYELIGSIDNNVNTEKQYLNKIIQSIDETLDSLLQRKAISKDHITKLNLSKRTNIKLSNLNFLPEINSDSNSNLLLQPRILFYQTPIQILATFLEQCIQPLFEQISQSITFNNNGDFMRKLRYHCNQKEFFRSTTYFITFEIHHLYTHLEHKHLLTALQNLLHNPLIYQRHHQGITNEGIEELTNLFLQNLIFIYNEKLYRYRKGCPFDFPLSRLLFNIYLYHWQFTLLQPVRIANEFYGLYHATGFLTWNKSLEEINKLFHEINQSFKDSFPSIYLTTSIDNHVHYMNCYIENRNGNLFTRVYYDPSKQSFILPYATEHPRLYHRKWFRFALVRAGLYCTQVEDFYDEQLYIQLTFLANGYSLQFVEYHTQQFFRLVNYVHTETKLNQHRYNIFRTNVFRYHSTSIDHLKKQKELEINQQLIHLTYLYDWGTRWQFNEQFYKKWIDILEQDPKFKRYKLKIKLHSKHCYPSNMLLGQ